MTAGAVVSGVAQLAVLTLKSDVAFGWRIAGLALFAAAHGVFWWAIASHGADRPNLVFAADGPSSLVRDGPYRWIRHPFYLAYMIGWSAGAVAGASPSLAASAAAMFVIYFFAARSEVNGFYASPFAADYLRYARQTGMFLPGLGRPR